MFFLDKELLVYFGYYSIISYLNIFAAVDIIDPERTLTELYDLGYRYFPEISRNYQNVSIVILYFYFVFRWLSLDQKVLAKFFKLLAILFTMRIFAFVMTVVPPTTESCYGRNPGDSVIWYYLMEEKCCLDYMFSGHACHIVIIFLLTVKYSSNKVEKIVMTILTPLMLLLIIAARMHYSVDVYIACLLSYLLFNNCALK